MNAWQDFFEQFNSHNGEFVHSLAEKYSILTKMEFRLCCLLRAGYNNKSIAEITNRSLRAVETARYRLRKKLPITTHEDLSVFLMRL